MDGEPWNPELLDWLASDFVDRGYDIKALIATIMNSRTYQLPAVPRKGEAPAKYVFRGPELRRMTAEQFADGVASITGEWPALSRVGNPPGGGRGGPLVISGAPSDGAGIIRVVPGAFPPRQADLRDLRRLVVYHPVEGVALRPQPSHRRLHFRLRPPITFGNGVSPAVFWIARWDVRSAIRCIRPATRRRRPYRRSNW